MASATAATHVPGGGTSRTEKMRVEGLHPVFWVAESGRHGDRSLLRYS